MGADVVVCYSSKDRDRVVPFVERLRSMGISVWIDQDGIEGASLWRKKIVESIKASKVLILMLSQSSVISDTVVKEVTLASEKNKHILPLELEPVEIPESIELQLIGLHHIKLFQGDRESNFQKIAHDLQGMGVKFGGSVEPTPTIEGPSVPPLPSRQENLPRPANDSDRTTPRRYPDKRTIVMVVVAFISIVAVALFVWFIRGTQTRNEASTKSQPSPTSQPTEQTTETPQPPLGMVAVSGGTFMMGRNADEGGDQYERPAHSVTVKPFLIDVYEVTREAYQKFLQATNRRPPRGWSGMNYPKGTGKQPVTGVTWDDANAYAAWGKNRLPTEEEWEFAARGTDGRLYPWGNEWRPGLANADPASKGLADVGTFTGASPFGAYDMAGNAWEWTANDSKAYPGGTILSQGAGQDLKVIRGNMYKSNPNQATTTFRRGWPARAADNYDYTGFRCARDITK